MSQASVFSFYPSHVRFADNLIALRNKARIDRPTVSDIEIALPTGDKGPEGIKSLSAMIPKNPTQDSLAKVVNGRPQPNLVFLNPQKFLVRRVLRPLG
jgi:hypothetical protein